MEKLITVIIPVYNVEKYLSRCLESIITQTYSHLQIICVNDGSTDNSLIILEEYQKKDKRIEIITQENLGLSEARNTGLTQARGSYVSFIDSDDWIDNTFYENLITAILESNSEIAAAGIKNFSPNKIKANKTYNGFFTDYSKIVSRLFNGSVCDKLFSIDLFRKNNINFIKGRYFEDNIVLLQLVYYSNQVIFIKNVFYNYYRNPLSICNTISDIQEEKRRKDKLFMIEQIMKFSDTMQLNKREINSIKEFLLRTLAFDFLYEKSSFHKEIILLLGKKFVFLKKISLFFSRQHLSKNKLLRKVYSKIIMLKNIKK